MRTRNNTILTIKSGLILTELAALVTVAREAIGKVAETLTRLSRTNHDPHWTGIGPPCDQAYGNISQTQQGDEAPRIQWAQPDKNPTNSRTNHDPHWTGIGPPCDQAYGDISKTQQGDGAQIQWTQPDKNPTKLVAERTDDPFPNPPKLGPRLVDTDEQFLPADNTRGPQLAAIRIAPRSRTTER